jgi:hypothetical protein
VEPRSWREEELASRGQEAAGTGRAREEGARVRGFGGKDRMSGEKRDGFSTLTRVGLAVLVASGAAILPLGSERFQFLWFPGDVIGDLLFGPIVMVTQPLLRAGCNVVLWAAGLYWLSSILEWDMAFRRGRRHPRQI